MFHFVEGHPSSYFFTTMCHVCHDKILNLLKNRFGYYQTLVVLHIFFKNTYSVVGRVTLVVA